MTEPINCYDCLAYCKNQEEIDKVMMIFIEKHSLAKQLNPFGKARPRQIRLDAIQAIMELKMCNQQRMRWLEEIVGW